MSNLIAEQRIKFVCSNCGSDIILRDAYAFWNIEVQEWQLHSLYDDYVCDACGIHDTEEKEPIE